MRRGITPHGKIKVQAVGKWLLLLFFMSSLDVGACPVLPARVRFQGTAFETQPFEVTGNKIRFFRGTLEEVALYYNLNSNKWCYGSRLKVPRAACLTQVRRRGRSVLSAAGKILHGFALLNRQKKIVAELTFKGKLLTLALRDPLEKPTGKQIVFEDQSSAEVESLNVHGWNCPNPRFLSCAGAELRTIREKLFTPEIQQELAVKEVELSGRLIRYASSCDGLHQLTDNKPTSIGEK